MSQWAILNRCWFSKYHREKLLWDLEHDNWEEGKFFYREEICIRKRRNVIVNLDGYHSYRDKIEKENPKKIKKKKRKSGGSFNSYSYCPNFSFCYLFLLYYLVFLFTSWVLKIKLTALYSQCWPHTFSPLNAYYVFKDLSWVSSPT